MPAVIKHTYKLRYGTADEWFVANPVLGKGEPGVEGDTEKFKMGDGVRQWLDLPYYLTDDAVSTYIKAEIDKLPPIGSEQLDEIVLRVQTSLEVLDLVTLWENAKA